MADLLKNIIVPDANAVTYNSYLKVHELLELQKPLSTPAEHDEMLFIVIHQAYELWFKQILHELSYCAAALGRDALLPCQRSLRRVSTIQNTLYEQVSILETMTPNDFNRFRDQLNPASGFQSFQFRLTEIQLGCRDAAYLRFFRAQPAIQTLMQQAMEQPSLYDHFLQYLYRRGLDIDKAVLKRNFTEPYAAHESVCQALLKVYQDPDSNYDLYMTLESLLDIDEKFNLWRYRHVVMVERMIGNRRGTGGSSGVQYLTQTLQKRFFPEIWQVRNHIGGDYGVQPR